MDDRLRAVLEGPGPSLTRLTGIRGSGKTHLLRRLVGGRADCLVFEAQAVPDDLQRTLFVGAAARAGWIEPGDPTADPPGWSDLLSSLVERIAAGEPRLSVFVLDDAHELLSEKGRVAAAFLEFWRTLRSRALPVHLVIAGTSPHLDSALEAAPELAKALETTIRAGPLGYRVLLDRVGAADPVDGLRAWSVFGGRASFTPGLERDASVERNARAGFLAADAPLRDLGIDALGADVQSPARYVAILRAMACGARSWGAIRSAVPGLTSGNQMAPYMARLEELELVGVERSLDAGPRSRRRRYRIREPAVSFWYRFVHPVRSEISYGRGPALWAAEIRPELDDHARSLFPALCRRWLLEHADEVLPSRARECGGIWGSDYDIEVAGTLRTGPAVYGTCVTDRVAGVEDDLELRERMRHTRYGFGREARLRLIFGASGFAPALLRTAARDPLLHVIHLDTVLWGRGKAS